MQLGFHTRLLVSLLIILFTVFIFLGAVLLSDANNKINDFRHTQARYQAKTLAEGSLDALVSEDYELLERWIHSSLPSDEFAYAALVRPSGQVLTHTDRTLVGKNIKTVTTNSETVSRQNQFNDRPVTEVIYPATLGNNVLAYAHIAYYIDIDTALRGSTMLNITGVLLIGLLLLVAASHFVTRSLTNPIKKLKDSVSDVTVDKIVDIQPGILNRSDEIGELARAFLNASKNLIASHDELTEKLKENKAIVDTANDGILVINHDNIIESSNSAIGEIFDYTSDEIIGQKFSLLIPNEAYNNKGNSHISDYVTEHDRRLIASRRELEGVRKDGTKFPLELSVGEIHSNSKVKYTATVRDITARYEYENALLVAKDAAEQGNRAKSEFLSTISHELRTPMNGIMGAIELAQETENLSQSMQDYLKIADRSAENLLEIVDSILFFAELDSRAIELDNGVFVPTILLNSIIESYQQQLTNRPVKLACELDEQIPHLLEGDATHLRTIVKNLLDNAVKFTREGKITLKAYPTNKLDDHLRIKFEIRDTGIGIQETEQTKIFNLFTQADGTFTRKFGGIGIGLTICQKLVDAMGGQIGVTSIPEKGSTFWFEIPLKVSKPGTTDTSKQIIAQQQVTIIEPKDKHLLIVEDDVLNQYIIKTFVTDMGYTVDIANNGAEAVDTVKKKKYDLILMDCQMPIMNGFEATGKIRKYEKESGATHTPIIALTANTMRGDREKCLNSGMDDYLAKPVAGEVLEEMIGSWIAKSACS